MNISETPSTPLPLNRVFLLALIAAGVFYFMPWSSHAATSLTFGAYDLAEWSSLHPAVRFVEPALQPTLLLRLPPVLLLIAFALGVGAPRFSWIWWFSLMVIIVGAVALMPPLEFFAATDDPNYRQQALLAGVTLLGGLIGISGIGGSLRWPLVAILCVSAIISAVMGLRDTQALLGAFQLETGLGVGIIGFVGCVLIAGVLALVHSVNKR